MQYKLEHVQTNLETVQTRYAPIVSVIFQGIGTLKFSPIFANTDISIFLIEKY